jgi:hypothetical protein
MKGLLTQVQIGGDEKNLLCDLEPVNVGHGCILPLVATIDALSAAIVGCILGSCGSLLA